MASCPVVDDSLSSQSFDLIGHVVGLPQPFDFR